MRKLRAVDLFCGAGGVSVGLERAGFDVTAVDINRQPHHRGGTFVQADALTYPLEGFDLVWASPPCQAYSPLRHLVKGKEYPDLIPATRERLLAAGVPYIIENVEGAPLAGNLIRLCGTMFGLQTPDGRAEIRRHRLFETSFAIALRPACQHGHVSLETLAVAGEGSAMGGRRGVLTVSGDTPNSANTPRKEVICVAGEHPHSPAARHHDRNVISVAGNRASSGGMAEPMGARRRRAMSVTGATAQTNVVNNKLRQTYSVVDARAAMGIDWMPMKYLSQAIPPAYAEFLGREAAAHIRSLE